MTNAPCEDSLSRNVAVKTLALARVAPSADEVLRRSAANARRSREPANVYGAFRKARDNLRPLLVQYGTQHLIPN